MAKDWTNDLDFMKFLLDEDYTVHFQSNYDQAVVVVISPECEVVTDIDHLKHVCISVRQKSKHTDTWVGLETVFYNKRGEIYKTTKCSHPRPHIPQTEHEIMSVEELKIFISYYLSPNTVKFMIEG